jgi:HEAT repeat protein
MALPDLGKPNVEKLKARYDVEGLIKALNYKKDKNVRSEAAQALGDIFDGRVVGALGEALKDEDVGVRMDVVHALGRIRDPGSMDVLIVALKDADPGIRSLAQKMLISHVHSLKVEPDIEGLVRAASSDDEYIRLNAVSALGEVGDERAARALASISLDDTYYPVRFEAAESLRRIGDKRAVEMLVSALKAPDVSFRIRAAEALGRIGDRRAVNALCEAMEDDEEAVRRASVDALGKIGDPRVMNLIVAAMKRNRRPAATDHK